MAERTTNFLLIETVYVLSSLFKNVLFTGEGMRPTRFPRKMTDVVGPVP